LREIDRPITPSLKQVVNLLALCIPLIAAENRLLLLKR